jgi:hypothetical protein
MAHVRLTESIQSLYPCPLSDAETHEAARNLLGFMELLLEIDAEHGITRANGCEVQP